MTTESLDPLEIFALLNPVPPDRLGDLARGPDRESTFARIVARRETEPSRGLRIPRRRRLVAALVVLLALAIPALAFSGALDSLFGFSNHGARIRQGDQWLVREVHMITGEAPTKVVQLASRDGWTFYAARTKSDVCYFSAPPPGSESDGIPNESPGGTCKDAAGESDFPSPTRPVFNMSRYLNSSTVTTLTGVAADGVSSVQVLALSDCHVVVTAPVQDNVYLADNLPILPEAQIVARDARGNAVWHQAVGAGIQPAPPSNSCGLG